MTDADARTLLARMLLQAAAEGDRKLLKLLTPAAKGDAEAFARFKAAVAPVGKKPSP